MTNDHYCHCHDHHHHSHDHDEHNEETWWTRLQVCPACLSTGAQLLPCSWTLLCCLGAAGNCHQLSVNSKLVVHYSRVGNCFFADLVSLLSGKNCHSCPQCDPCRSMVVTTTDPTRNYLWLQPKRAPFWVYHIRPEVVATADPISSLTAAGWARRLRCCKPHLWRWWWWWWWCWWWWWNHDYDELTVDMNLLLGILAPQDLHCQARL